MLQGQVHCDHHFTVPGVHTTHVSATELFNDLVVNDEHARVYMGSFLDRKMGLEHGALVTDLVASLEVVVHCPLKTHCMVVSCFAEVRDAAFCLSTADLEHRNTITLSMRAGCTAALPYYNSSTERLRGARDLKVLEDIFGEEEMEVRWWERDLKKREDVRNERKEINGERDRGLLSKLSRYKWKFPEKGNETRRYDKVIRMMVSVFDVVDIGINGDQIDASHVGMFQMYGLPCTLSDVK